MALIRRLERRNKSRMTLWDELEALDNRISGIIDINAQTGLTYTLVITDASKLVTMSNASANTLTVPLDLFDIGTQILVSQEGVGQTTIAADGGVTLHSAGALLSTTSQYSTVTLIKKATNTWLVVGDLA